VIKKMQFVSNLKSIVDINPIDLTGSRDLPGKDYSITLPIDLNTLWAGLPVPNRPLTDNDQNIQQGNSGGELGAIFSKLQDFKKTWGITLNNKGESFTDDMKKVLSHLLDPSSPDSLLTGVTYASRLKNDKIANWLQGGINTFYEKVFTEPQLENIMDQIRNMHKYQPNGVALSEGDIIGVIVCLRTSDDNIFTLHFFLQQTVVYVGYIPQSIQETLLVIDESDLLNKVTARPVYTTLGYEGFSKYVLFGSSSGMTHRIEFVDIANRADAITYAQDLYDTTTEQEVVAKAATQAAITAHAITVEASVLAQSKDDTAQEVAALTRARANETPDEQTELDAAVAEAFAQQTRTDADQALIDVEKAEYLVTQTRDLEIQAGNHIIQALSTQTTANNRPVQSSWYHKIQFLNRI
jgi:hypothetical protein